MAFVQSISERFPAVPSYFVPCAGLILLAHFRLKICYRLDNIEQSMDDDILDGNISMRKSVNLLLLRSRVDMCESI